MKTLLTIVLSLVAIIASLVFVASCLLVYASGARASYIMCAAVALAVIVAAMWTISQLKRKG